jgi:hypothetical protein
LYEHVLLYINSFEVFMLYILMYPVLNSTHVLDFLDTSGMSVTVCRPIKFSSIYFFLNEVVMNDMMKKMLAVNVISCF